MEEKIEGINKAGKAAELTRLNLEGAEPACKLVLLAPFEKLTHLSLKNVGLTSLKGFPKLQNLKMLDLSSNKIPSTLFPLMNCPSITHLNLSNNLIKDVHVLKSLGKLKQLQSLQLVNCEVTKVADYRKKVFRIIKSLQDLDGENKTAEDALEPAKDESKENMDVDKASKPKKRKAKEGESPSKRICFMQKNALMKLNELKPGLTYVVDSITGPPHNPMFTVSVDVEGNKFTGYGNSKQLAKHSAAEAVINSLFHQDNVLTAMRSEPMDFTSDDQGQNNDFKCEAEKNGSSLTPKVGVMKTTEDFKKAKRILTEAETKNPVMLLNEIHPGLEYKMLEEDNTSPNHRFRISVELNGKTYEGTGANKKLAKASAARAVMSHLYNISYQPYIANIFKAESVDPELFNFPQGIADEISKLIQVTFKDVMIGQTEHAKWKIMAGIAMTKGDDMKDIQIIGLGTGTKCVSGEHISLVGANLNDCHAEIISRRCIKEFLYTNLEYHLEGDGDLSILQKKDGGGFCLRPGIKFHLYITTAPCGDARIFCPHDQEVDKHPNRNSRGVLRTKIESGEGTIPVKVTQGVQTWDGILPGQERLLTMSCSDKVASWNVLGIQGALLSHFVDPIYLDSVILGGLFHPSHLSRALFGRFETSLGNLPTGYRLNKPKLAALTSPETRQLVKSPNLSINWTTGLGRAEVVNATTGKTESNQVSRLAKRTFFQRFLNIYDRLARGPKKAVPNPAVYSAYKSIASDYQVAKKALYAAFIKAKLGRWVNKPVEQSDFGIGF